MYLTSNADSILSSLNIHAPLCTFRVTKPQAPWLTYSLILRIEPKNKLYHLARRTRSIRDINIYRQHRDEFTSDLSQAIE